MDRRSHWEVVHGTQQPDQLSWFQARAGTSVELITESAPDPTVGILDVGAGASPLSAELASVGCEAVTVMDLALGALTDEGAGARDVRRVVGDALHAPFADRSFGVWHDRAAFHFFTAPADRDRYVGQVRRILCPGGTLIVATFAVDGPIRCSGLPVARYAPDDLQRAFGDGFVPVTFRREIHRTPSGTIQPFTWSVFRRGPD
ncbi:MAG: class I SAM-dependent methyltransferase [Gemmatimonadota bacterium]